jgi:ribosome biogenesis GTPase
MNDINFESLRTIGLSHAVLQCALSLQLSGHLMRVTEVHRDAVCLHDGTVEHTARLLPRLLRDLASQDDAVAAGDWVLASADAYGHWWVEQRLDPLTQLTRRDGDGKRHRIVSNVDVALLVMGLDADFNLRRLERYLALIHASRGVEAVVVLTKADLCSDVQAAIGALRERIASHVAVYAINGLDAAATGVLKPYMPAGSTGVVLGSSGAGKSTLTNTLLGRQIQDTGAVREADSRGKHTTTSRSLHLLPWGACLIDTPGVRTLRPDADEQTVAQSFDDIEALALHCRFRDCKHLDEPGCAVRAGVSADRLSNYHKLLREARRDTMTVLERQAELARWKAVSKSAKAWTKVKRGE